MTCDCLSPSSLMRSTGSVAAFDGLGLGRPSWTAGPAAPGPAAAGLAGPGPAPGRSRRAAMADRSGRLMMADLRGDFEARANKRARRDTASAGTPRRERRLGLKRAFYEVERQGFTTPGRLHVRNRPISPSGPVRPSRSGGRRCDGPRSARVRGAHDSAVIREERQNAIRPGNAGLSGSSRAASPAATARKPARRHPARSGKSGSGLDFRPPIVEERQDEHNRDRAAGTPDGRAARRGLAAPGRDEESR